MTATKQINRRWVVGFDCEKGVYLTYHDRPLAQDEKEFGGNARDHVNDIGIAVAIHGRVFFTQGDQSYHQLMSVFA